MKLMDIRIDELRSGDLLFPSRFAREAFGGGNYYCTERRSFMKDHQVFPAILLDPQSGKVTTPVGIQYLGGTSIVSVFSSR
jgi:hypothetical protein